MASINERIGVIEERTKNILDAVNDLKEAHSGHLDRCHKAMKPLIEENDKNTTFRQVCLWILTSSGIITFLGGMAWLGLKTALKA